MSRDDPQILDALVIGAGFAGLCSAIRLKQAGYRFAVLEQAPAVGGTWWWNTYPGIACDIPAHFYCFSFAPNPDWSAAYPPGPEIQRYLEDVTDRFGLRASIRFGTRVTQCAWESDRGCWRIETGSGEAIRARHLVQATGGLHAPNLPDIPGRDGFPGPRLHTARWDHSIDFKGKRVAIVGSAASAIQLAPALARDGAEVTLFQRTANYINSRGNHAYSARMRGLFRRFPWLMSAWRGFLRRRLDAVVYPIVRRAGGFGRFARGLVLKGMQARITDPDLQAALTPPYALGCKRMLISDDFYPALQRGDVRLVASGVERIEGYTVVAGDGTRAEADILVFATGYDIGAQLRALPVTGRDGRVLQDAWSEIAEAHRGTAVAGFPNYWIVTGPNTGVGTTSVIFMIETHVDYILRAMARAGSGTIEVRPEAQAAYNADIQSRLSDTVWATGGCDSWYKRPDGRIETLYPGNAADFRRMLKRVRNEEYVLTPGRVTA
ncbi:MULTISPECIES: flavin-containing monooxygenase [Hyphobacterium]|uniref:Flavin-containing monooxygenase n=1 Tax=Hyphobacterium vulgare TaxID=1736751 RepID=A0ABV7A171_9PROT